MIKFFREALRVILIGVALISILCFIGILVYWFVYLEWGSESRSWFLYLPCIAMACVWLIDKLERPYRYKPPEYKSPVTQDDIDKYKKMNGVK